MVDRPLALHFPDHRTNNPYQDLLAAALRRRGQDCDFAPSLRALLAKAISCRIRRRRVVVHLHWTHNYFTGRSSTHAYAKGVALLGTILACRLLRCRAVHTIHNLGDHENRSRPTEIRLTRMLGRQLDALLVHDDESSVVARHLFRRRHIPTLVSPHGGYEDAYGARIEHSEARAAVGVCDESFVFLYLGEVRRYKRVELLIDSFANSFANDSNTLLWIIGKPRDHEIQASIERKAERLSNVMLCLQRLPDEQMATVLSAADVFVVPSALSIATSGSAMLGLTYGCRLVAPAVNQIVSSVPTSLNALFLFGNDEPSALRAALDKARSSESPPYKPMRQLMMDRWDEAADAVMRAYRPSVSTT